MRNIYKKAASLLLVTMILLSMVVTGAVAEAAAPTEVKSCEKSGFYTTVLNFEFSDTTWLDAVNGVTVNGTAFTGQTISSFSNDTGIWCVGNATGAYGSYKALQLAIENDASFPLTVEVTAAGYNKLTERQPVELGKAGFVENATLTGPDAKGAEWTSGGVRVINNTGATLPSTGGMGTTLFYVIGGGLMVAAVVLLVTKKRMENK